MDETPSSQPILDTLRTVEFRLGLKGYNVDEVDEYLEKAAVEAEQVRSRLRTADDRVRAAEERLRRATERISQLEAGTPQLQKTDSPKPSVPDPGAEAASVESLQKTLLLAQRFVEQTKRESEAEAAGVVARAEEQARQMTTDAEKRLRDDVAKLEAQRARLAAEVDAVGKHLGVEREKIRSTLREMLEWVEERLAPPASGTPGDGSSSGGASAVPEVPETPEASGAPQPTLRGTDTRPSENGTAATELPRSPVGAQVGPKNLFDKARGPE